MKSEEIHKIIEDAGTGVDLDRLTDTMDFREIGADSLDVMAIVLGVQEASGITIPDSDIDELYSIERICKYVDEKST